MIEKIIINCLCILVLAIVLLGLYFSRDSKDVKNKRLRYLAYSVILFLSFNIACDCLEGKKNLDTLNFVFNLLTFFGIDIIVLAFNSYLSVLLAQSKERKYSFMTQVVIFTSCARIITTLILALTGNLFTIKDGIYQDLNLCFIIYIFTGLILIELLFNIIANRRCFNKKQFVVIILYELIPIIPVVLELLISLYSLTGAAITLCVLLIYILLQDSAFEQTKIKQEMLEELSKTDLLTNLQNRRSYYEFINQLCEDDNIGIVFCDINGLKYTNDHFGHSAGDELILRFSKMLSKSFKKDSCFRIAGDEFIVIIENVDEELLETQLKKFKNDIRTKENIAAIGYSFGKVRKIENLTFEAEQRMYEDKLQHSKKRDM